MVQLVMVSDDSHLDLSNLMEEIGDLLVGQLWDDYTKASLHMFLSLRNIEYIADDKLSVDNSLTLAIKHDGSIYLLKVGTNNE